MQKIKYSCKPNDKGLDVLKSSKSQTAYMGCSKIPLREFSVELIGYSEVSLEFGIRSSGNLTWTPSGSSTAIGFTAIAFRLQGAKSDQYDIVYRAHLSGIGDVPAVSNGAFIGTRGQNRALEYFDVEITAR